MDPIRTPHEKSRFAIPVAVAVAAHAFLFFGFKSPVVVKLPITHDQPDPSPLPPTFIEFAAPASDPGYAEPAGSPRQSSAPAQPDVIPNVVPTTSITVPIEPLQPSTRDTKTNIIPDGIPGINNFEGTGGPGIMIHGLRELDNVPRATFQARPNYPYTLRNQGISGEVVVDFLVDEQGQVSDVRVVRSSNSEFERPTVLAVQKWRFEPGKRQGRAVRFRMSQAVTFAVGD